MVPAFKNKLKIPGLGKEIQGYVKIETELTNDMEKIIARPYTSGKGMSELTPPQTGTGILGCANTDKLVPEYYLKFDPNINLELTNNSKAIVYDVDDNLIQTYIYNLKKHIWEEQLK